MKILEINKFFYRRGGAEEVFLDTISGLKEAGDAVAEFSMHGEYNELSDFDKYFVSELPELLGSTSVVEKVKVFGRLFYSREVNKKITALVKDFKPDVAHLHNVYHHLSASLFTTLKKLHVPIVLTLHDVFPLVPNHSFMVGENLREDLLFKKAYNCTRYRCVNNQLLPSTAATLEHYYYSWRGIWGMVDAFIAPSQFMKDIMVRAGYDAKKIHVITNFAPPVTTTTAKGDALLYLGRLHPEKGIKIFMEAVKLLPKNIPVIVAGDGPLKNWVTDFIAQNNLTQVDYVGWVEGEKQAKIIARSKVMCLPSVFYENCSLSILRALAEGCLVIASNRGGNPELVIDGSTGFLSPPESPTALKNVIEKVFSLPSAQIDQITTNAKRHIAEKYNKKAYFQKLHTLLKNVVQKPAL